MINIKIPKQNASDDDVIISEIFFESGEYVDEDTIIFEYETSKANFEFETVNNGFLYFNFSVGDSVRVQTDIAYLSEIELNSDEIKKLFPVSDVTNFTNKNITKKALKLIKENSIDVKEFKEDLITEKVVKEFLSNSKNDNKINFSFPVFKERIEVELLGNLVKLNDYKISDNIQLGSNVKIECSFLKIGKNVKIGNNVFLKGNEIIIDDNSRIGSNVILTSSLYEGSLLVGKRCMIGSDSYLNNEKDIIIEDDVCISSDVKLITHRQWHSPLLGGESFFDKITLKNYCFIGPGTIIMPGITVGKWTTVLANSSIVNDLEEKILAGGVPAIKIKQEKRLNINVGLDQIIKILLTSLSKFNFMLPNKNWQLRTTENQFCYKIENKMDDIKCNLNLVASSKEIKSEDDFYVLLKGKLPQNVQGIEIESHHIKINDYKVERYLFDSFFNCGIHLKCY